MSIFQNITDARKAARLSRDNVSAATLTTFSEDMRSDIMGDLSMAMYGIYAPEDSVVIRYLKNAIKTAKNAVVLAQKQSTSASDAFVAKTELEITLLESFLPKQLTDHELGIAVGKIMSNTTLEGGKLMGHIMSELKRDYEGLFDASKVKGFLTAK